MVKGRKVPYPTKNEMMAAVSQKREIIAFSAVNDDKRLFLKVASHNEGTSIIYLSPSVADALLHYLHKILQFDEDAGSPTKWASVGLQEAYGRHHPSTD